MNTRFEFRLVDADAPAGEIDVDDVVAILQRLQELATRVGRIETQAAERGRPARVLTEVAKLRLAGLRSGSTVIEVKRVEDDERLDFDLAHEAGFDARFAEIIEAIGDDVRPSWASDAIAETAGELVGALRKAAPRIEFAAGGRLRRTFDTATIHRETWRSPAVRAEQSAVEVIGRLYAVNLKSHRLQVQDDLGNEFALPNVADDDAAAALIGRYVSVYGRPERDSRGRIAHILNATIEEAPALPGSPGTREAVPLEAILASAPGPQPGGIAGLTDAEVDAFLEMLRS